MTGNFALGRGKNRLSGGGLVIVGDVLRCCDCGERALVLQQQGWMRCRAELTTEAMHSHDERHDGLQTASYRFTPK